MMKSKKHLFNLPDNVTYLNCAYMSPQLKSVTAAGLKAVEQKTLPYLTGPDDFFSSVEDLSAEYAKLVNAGLSQRIAILPSVSYGMATVAKNVELKRGDKIIIIDEQFPSNVYTWQRLAEEKKAKLVTIAAENQEQKGKVLNERLLESIDSKTKVVALAHVHWADGTRVDLQQVRKRTKDVGALLIVDGTQSVGALPFDIKKIKPDALICAGYKWLMGPYSIGLGYFGPYFDQGKPIEENWINRLHSEQFSKLVKYQPKYKPKAGRYSVGEQSNFILVPMMLEAVKQINKWGPENIQQYCKSITSKPLKALQEEGFIIEDEAWRGHHLFGIRLPKKMKMDPAVKKIQKEKIYVSIRGNSIRVAANVFNTKEDMEKLVNVLTG